MSSANHFASTNRLQLAYIPETNWGVTPVTGAGAYLRMTGESLEWTRTKQSDKEIRSDRQLSSTTTVSAQAAGDVKIHMQYAEYDPLFAALMQNSFVKYGTNGVGTTFTADYTTSTLTASAAPSGASAFTTLQQGQWFLLVAPTSPNNGKLFRVSTTVAPSSTVLTVDPGTPFVAATGVALCTVSTARLTNGVTMPSFTLEKYAADVGQYFTYTGMCVSKFATSFASGSLTEGTFTFLGKSQTAQGSTLLPGSTAASQPFNIQNGVTGVAEVWEGGAPITGTAIKSLSLTIDNTLRAQEAIGTLGLAGIGVGTFMVKGTMEIYFADLSIYNKFNNDTYTQVVLSSQDAAGNGYIFTMPKVSLDTNKVEASGKDADLMMTFDYSCYGDMTNTIPALRQTLFIDRVGVATP